MSDRVQIPAVLGCLKELQSDLAAIPAQTPIEFLGNYADIGPEPLATFDFLIQLKKLRPNCIFRLGIHDEFLLCAAGALNDGLALRTEWQNPFHGTVGTIAAYGLDPWDFIFLPKDERFRLLGQRMKERGHLDFLLDCHRNTNIRAIPPKNSYVYKFGYFESHFCHWLFSQKRFERVSYIQNTITDCAGQKQTRSMGRMEASALRSYVESNPEIWNQNLSRQNYFSELQNTKSVFISYDLNSPATFIPKFHDAADELLPLISPALKFLQQKLGRGYWCRIILAQLPPGEKIKAHIDPGWPYSVQRRFHWAITTNEAATLRIDGIDYHLEESELWEIDNKKVHSAENCGPTPRVHLIADFVSADLAKTQYPDEHMIDEYEKRLLNVAKRKKQRRLAQNQSIYKDKLHFKYLGGRNYIDITQITQLFFNSSAGVEDPYQMRNFRIKVRKPILTQGWLVPRTPSMIFDIETALAEISCDYAGQRREWFIFPTECSIIETAPDPDEYTDRRIRIVGNSCYLTDKICDFSTKTLMLMGKALICRNLPSASPRVASFNFKRPPTTEEIPFLSMQINQIKNNKFFVLDAFVREEFIGRIFVHN